MTRCAAKTAAGTRCKNKAKDGKTLCSKHSSRSRPTKITNPLQMFRAGRLDANSPVSKHYINNMNRIVGPLKKNIYLSTYYELIKQNEDIIKKYEPISKRPDHVDYEYARKIINTAKGLKRRYMGKVAAAKKSMDNIKVCF